MVKRVVLLLAFIATILFNIQGAGAEGKEYLDVIVYMEEDNQALAQAQAGEDKDKYIELLKSLAARSQEDLMAYLAGEPGVKDYKGYFISNLVHVQAQDYVIDEIKARDDVDSVVENGFQEGPQVGSLALDEGQLIPSISPEDSNWNRDIMRLEEAREKYKVYGEGITIGFIDSGVDFHHQEILANFRGYQPGAGLDMEGNYIDLLGQDPVFKQHGTGVVSIAAGVEDGLVQSVAPQSKWILARAFDNQKSKSSNETIIEAAQWMIAPDGDPSKRPDIINNSWGGTSNGGRWFNDILETWNYLDIFSVFAAGNSMDPADPPGAGSIENPASLPGAFAVGSIGRDKSLSYFSKKGPSLFDQDLIKPEVVAPGEDIIIALPGNNYGKFTGTSASTPHISGLAALIMDLRPDGDSQDYARVIIESAEPLRSQLYPSSPNMGFGHGLPNAERALDLAKSMKVTDRISGANRFETAINISRAYFPDGARTVYLTNGNSYIDALVSSSLANLSEGPLLLSSRSLVDQETIQEIARLRPDKVLIVGGPANVGDQVKGQIEEATGLRVERMAGASRYDTSARVARALAQGGQLDHVYLVNGSKEVDAISASGPACHLKKPVLLTEANSLPEVIQTSLRELGVKRISLIGGESTISPALEESLRAQGYEVERLGGSDRYETSVMVNDDAYDQADHIFLANGINSVDALTVGPIAGIKARPVLLVPHDQIPVTSGSYINKSQCKNITILGGINSISEDLEYKMLFY